MESRFTLERICSHQSEDGQLMFALRAIELLPLHRDYAVAASQAGLILRGETEAAFERPIELLKAVYGDALRIGELIIRYRRKGASIEEPFVNVRVRSNAEHFDAVRDDLLDRGGTLIDAEVGPLVAVLRAIVPLRRLLGYAAHLAALTEGSGREVIWFSHYSGTEKQVAKSEQSSRADLPQ
jgi:Elongation factor G C-terminus